MMECIRRAGPGLNVENRGQGARMFVQRDLPSGFSSEISFVMIKPWGNFLDQNA